MAKRFTDSRKWDDPWFRRLPLHMKVFWFYLLDRCDYIGIWKVDLEVASFLIGSELNQDELVERLGDRIVIMDNDKWFIPKFLLFQYGPLSTQSRLHARILKTLEERDLINRLSSDCLQSDVSLKDKDKDHTKDLSTNTLNKEVIDSHKGNKVNRRLYGNKKPASEVIEGLKR